MKKRVPKCSCGTPLPKPWHLACLACWSFVPKHQQDEVYRLFRTAKGSPEHRAAVRVCYQSIHAARNA